MKKLLAIISFLLFAMISATAQSKPATEKSVATGKSIAENMVEFKGRMEYEQ